MNDNNTQDDKPLSDAPTQGFELWEGRRATYRGVPGQMVPIAWAHVPEDKGTLARSGPSEHWDVEHKKGFLTFIDEYPGYKRVEVKDVWDLKDGDFFICASGNKFNVRLNSRIANSESARCVRSGLTQALGYVWRPMKEGS